MRIKVEITFDKCDPYTIKCESSRLIDAILSSAEAEYISIYDASHGYVIDHGKYVDFTYKVEGIRGRKPKNG